MRIAILGFAQSVKDAPFNDPSWTMWGMNGLWRVLTEIPESRFSLWFEPHTPDFLDRYGIAANIGTQQQEWLAKEHPFVADGELQLDLRLSDVGFRVFGALPPITGASGVLALTGAELGVHVGSAAVPMPSGEDVTIAAEPAVMWSRPPS